MGKVTFTELAFLLVQGREATPGQTALLDAVLVSLADHGLTPTVLAARLTYTGAPESLQGAVAAGLLGAGTVFLGVVEDTAAFLEPVVAEAGGVDAADDRLAAAARAAVDVRLAAGGRIPGLGHPVHKAGRPAHAADVRDRRAARGARPAPARRCGWSPTRTASCPGRALPINGAGVGGAALADLGFPPRIVRGFALIARTRRPGRPPGGGDGPPAGHAAVPRGRPPRFRL